jgi:hypothetical protein
MKTFRFDFTGGINNVGDKAIIDNRFLTFADNVDLRSGSIKPFKSPTFKMNATAGTTRIWEHKGVFYQSAAWRDYTAVTSENTDIIFYSETGNPPKMLAGNITVALGVTPPKVAPFAIESTSLAPSVVAMQVDGGSLAAGTIRSYRVAVETDQGIQPPSAPVGVQLQGVYSTSTTIVLWNGSTIVVAKDQPRLDLAVDISWSPVQGAVRYHVFAGPNGQEKLAISLPASSRTYRDTGVVSGDGELASRYISGQPYQYISTFLREVGPTVSESGPSPVSKEVTSRSGRKIAFDLLGDGYFSQTGTVTKTGADISASDSTSSNGWEWVISSVVRANISNHVKVTLSTAVTIPSKTIKVRFSGMGDVAWDNFEHEMVQDLLDNTVVYVKGLGLPDSIPAGAKMHLKAATILFSDAHNMKEGDAIAVTVGGAESVYPVLKIDTTTKITYGGFLANDDTVTQVRATPTSYIKYRNLYRTSRSGTFLLVKKFPISTLEFEDDVSEDNLGGPPTSYYTDNGIPVIFAPPPNGLTCLTEHYGMLFGIDGKRVRWTPTGEPNAWPDNFYEEGFGSTPLALASFAQSLIVLCEDAIYRIDGNTPTGLSLTRTMAEDGCIAPRAVLKTTDHGMLYVSRRGVMAFDGMQARCLTDDRIGRNVWSNTSIIKKTSTYAYKYATPLLTFLYAALCEKEPNLGTVKEANGNFFNNESPYIAMDLRAFYHNGKAYFFWDNRSNQTQAHTCIVIDLRAPGAPITTLGLRIKDVAVSATENVYFLMDEIN